MCVCARAFAPAAPPPPAALLLCDRLICQRAHTSHVTHNTCQKKTQKQKQHKQGSAFYLGGAALVVVGWTIVGLALESYGFWLLFCEFFPVLLQVSWWYYEFSY